MLGDCLNKLVSVARGLNWSRGSKSSHSAKSPGYEPFGVNVYSTTSHCGNVEAALAIILKTSDPDHSRKDLSKPRNADQSL